MSFFIKNKNKTSVIAKQKSKGVSPKLGFKNDKYRFYAMWCVTIVCFLLLIGRAFWVQVLNQKFYGDKANIAINRTRVINPNRGVIYDRFKTPLAVSTPMHTLSFNAREFAAEKIRWEKRKAHLLSEMKFAKHEEEKEKLAYIQRKDARFDIDKLALLSNKPVDKIHTLLSQLKTTNKKGKAIPLEQQLPVSQYYILGRRLPPSTAKVILDYQFHGVHKQTEYKRYYPQPQPSAQLLGYMGKKITSKTVNGKKIIKEHYAGKAGLEYLFNKSLSGTPGKMSLTQGADSFGVVDDKMITAEVAGEDLVSSIDARLQYLLYSELEKAGVKNKARSASGIVIDVRTGEVLAISNWPSFNSNKLKNINNVERNRVLLDVFEPGSVVKPLTVIAGFESGKVHKNSVVHTGNSITIGKKRFTDHGLPPNVSMKMLIQKSSNLASIRISQMLPRDGIANMFLKLGLGKKTALNFPFEQQGSVVAPTKKQPFKRANMTFGYAINVTLAQLAKAYTVIGAHGVLRPLTFEKVDKKPEGMQVISSDSAKDILELMQTVTEGGTGKNARIPGYTVAGKTGTAKKSNPQGGYYDDKYRGLFIGIAPVTNPHFVTAIVIEDPSNKKHTGGQVAAPVFKNVMQEVLRLYNVPMDKKL